MVRIVLNRGADVNAGWKTPLFVASEHGHCACVEVLLAHHANIDALSRLSIGWDGGMSALWAAYNYRKYDVARLLLARGANPDCDIGAHLTPLQLACERNDADFARLLLERGSPDKVNHEYSNPPLVIAASQGNVKIVRLLLDRGARVSLTRKDGHTALGVAAFRGDVECVDALLERGAPVDDSLILAARRGVVHVIDRLLAAGARINLVAKKTTALWEAARNGHLQAVRRLLAYRRDLRFEALANFSSVLHVVHLHGFLHDLPWLPYADTQRRSPDGYSLLDDPDITSRVRDLLRLEDELMRRSPPCPPRGGVPLCKKPYP